MQRFQLLRRRNVWQRVACWDARTHVSQSLFLTRSFSALPDHDIVGLPALSPTMETGTIAKWMKQEGEMVSAGDIICQVETDKAVVDFEAQDDLYLAKILKPEGSADIKVGEPIFVSVSEQSDVAAFTGFSIENAASNASPAASVTSNVPQEKKTATPTSVPTQSQRPSTDRVLASPLAKKLARESGVLLASINGTGPRGRIVQADVQDAIANGTTSTTSTSSETTVPSISIPSPSSEYTDYPISLQAQQYAQQLTQQKLDVPHFHLTIDITMDKLLQARERLNAGLAQDAQLSVYDFMIRAASLAMKQVPAVNSAWKETFIRQYHDTNINIVVSKEGGSIAPVVMNVNQKGLSEINSDIQTIMSTTSFTSEQVATGTFTISNIGMYQVQSLAGIVSREQACFLGLGSIEKKVVPNDDPDAIQIYKYAQVLTATLACDHRVVDGAVGAQWLNVFKDLVEDPLKMIL